MKAGGVYLSGGLKPATETSRISTYPPLIEAGVLPTEIKGDNMVSRKVRVINATGLHLKPAAYFCKEALLFKSLVTFSFGNTTANAKSVLSVLSACVKCGDEIEIVCDGPDEREALRSMCAAVENGLGEQVN